MKIYCITHKPLDYINKLGLIPFGVGLNDYPNGYLEEKKGTNISNKNKYYSETSFHYWYWQNILKSKLLIMESVQIGILQLDLILGFLSMKL